MSIEKFIEREPEESVQTFLICLKNKITQTKLVHDVFIFWQGNLRSRENQTEPGTSLRQIKQTTVSTSGKKVCHDAKQPLHQKYTYTNS